MECWLWRLMSLLWAEHKFKKAENWSITIFILVARWKHWSSEKNYFGKILGGSLLEVVDYVGISFNSCQASFRHETYGSEDCSKEKKQRGLGIAQEMFTTLNDNPDLLKKVITGEKSWMYGYDIQTKAQSSHWKRPGESRPKKARQVRWNGRICLLFFFDCNGVVHH